jgi:predicted unusual protein kinase regulating ubiquinone biosynthesis (AarF/ABC1/UbiB family)
VADEDGRIPSGRLGRLARVAALGARTAGDLAKGQVKRALGEVGFEAERQAAKRVLETLGTMKGAAMKLGQQLALDADHLPPEAKELMAKLFAQAPRASYEDVAGVVEQELGAPPGESLRPL